MISENLIVLRPHRACFKNFCTGIYLPRWKASQEARQSEQSARWEAGQLDSHDNHEVQRDGQAALHPPWCQLACKRWKGSLSVCLVSIKNAEEPACFQGKQHFCGTRILKWEIVLEIVQPGAQARPESSYRRQIWGSFEKDQGNRAQG